MIKPPMYGKWPAQYFALTRSHYANEFDKILLRSLIQMEMTREKLMT